MKILFIFTGGTIGSTLSDGYISTDKTKPYAILNAYDKKYKIDFEYNSVEPYTILSEDSTGAELKLLSKAVLDNLDKGYDGIIITHGTDTLQYSSSIVAYTAGLSCIPIVFVSSNYPIENPLSNGLENLKGGIEFIKNKLGKGVFVSYKNQGENVKIHRSCRLIYSKPLVDDVTSLKNSEYGEFNKDFIFTKSPLYSEKQDEISPLQATNLTSFSSSILWLNQYAGMPYPTLDSNVKYILINAYHSGTINTASSNAREFFEQAKQKDIKVFICGITSGIGYKSTALFKEFNVLPIYDISPISAYIKLWLISTLNLDLSLLNKSLSGDQV